MADKPKIAGLPRNVVIVGGVGALGDIGVIWWRRRQAAAAAAADSSTADQSSSQGGYSGAYAPVPALAYGANIDEIIATVNGPSVGQGDDDDTTAPVTSGPTMPGEPGLAPAPASAPKQDTKQDARQEARQDTRQAKPPAAAKPPARKPPGPKPRPVTGRPKPKPKRPKRKTGAAA